MGERRHAATITAGAQRRRELRGLAAPLQLVAARARCRPGRWLWPVLGLTLAVAFACGVAAEATIAGDRAARESLAHLDPLQRAVTLTQQGPASDAVDRRARALLAGLGLPAPTRTVLLNPVRLSGRVVRLAAIEPLRAWATRPPGRCRPRACPALLAGGAVGSRTLRAPGVRIVIAGDGRLRSAAPLGFAPTAHGQPLLLSGDVAGLSALPALSSVYRTDSWVSVPRLSRLHSWELAGLERRLTRVQAGLAPTQGLTLSAPTDALQSAREQAAAAPRRLLVAGGGARGPLLIRLALVGLARSPVAPALAVAFVAVSTGLAGFAIGYRATLRRGVADQAAQQVALDARIGPSASFIRPLDAAAPSRWRALAGTPSRLLAVRRTDGALPLSGNTITLPVLGVPASGLTAIRGWRAGDGSAPLATLARRVAPHGPTRGPGPQMPAGPGRLTVRVQAPDGEVRLSADLRGPEGTVTQVALGTASARPRVARAPVPARGGPYELEAFEVGEPTGVQDVNGHQNAENPAAATQSTTRVRLGRVFAGGRSLIAGWDAWRAVGAARVVAAGAGGVTLVYDDSGQPGVLRPRQPSDTRPVPVLTDRATAAGVRPGAELPVTVDGEPVTARVVGTLRRFPTIPPGGPGFVIADEATLDGALDASLPGQGRTDELWVSTARPERLRAALRRPPLNGLSVSFRADVQRSLSGDPIARGVLGTLLVAAATSGALAILGLLAALLGAMREVRVERDLVVLGLSPRQLRRERWARVLIAGTLGTLAGLMLAAVLTRLVVGAVHAAGTVAVPDPPLVAIAPWGELGLLALAAIAAFALVGAVATWLSPDER